MSFKTCQRCCTRYTDTFAICPKCMTPFEPQVCPSGPVVVDTEAQREIAEQVIDLPATENQEAASLRMRLRRVLNEMDREKLIELLLE